MLTPIRSAGTSGGAAPRAAWTLSWGGHRGGPAWSTIKVPLAVAFGSAFGPVSHDAVWAMGLIAAGISVTSIIAACRVGIAPWRFPASYLLGAMALSIATDLL